MTDATVKQAIAEYAKQKAITVLYSFLKMVAWYVKPENQLKGLIQAGNLKIPKTTAIFNMSSATSCPSLKLGICSAVVDGKNHCYAMKSERSYRPNVEPYRNRQQTYWLTTKAEEFVFEFMLINSLKPKPFTKVRLNEAGDFHSQECIAKAERIAQLLHQYGIRVYCYTSRKDLDFTKTKFLVVNGSGFKKAGVQNEFSIVSKEVGKNPKLWPKGYAKCPMDCTICDRCSIKGKNTFVVQH
jgi:hypothetical protein